MEIKSLAVGHGVIYYEVWYSNIFRSGIICQYIAYKYCFGGIQVVKYSIPIILRDTDKTTGFEEIELGKEEDYPCQ